MAKTYCNKCLFSKPVSDDTPCEFNIPTSIMETDPNRISIVDNYYCIENYNCLYGFSKNQYHTNIANLKDINIKESMITKANLKYYFIIDAREVKDENFSYLINTVNSLDIKPTKISILISPNKSEELYSFIQKQISCPKWTVHVFINSLPFNDCINIILDTNLPSCNAWCVIFYDGTKFDNNSNANLNLENIINYLHKKIIIQQTTYLGFINNEMSLHGLCLNCSLYKYLTSVIANDILKALKLTTDIQLSSYETA